MNAPVAVVVRSCECPGTPHGEGDLVLLAPTLSLAGGLAAEHDNSTALAETLANAGPAPEGGWTDDNSGPLATDLAERLRRRLMLTYVRYGAVGWNFEDEAGPIPFDVDTILADYGIAQPVTEKADELYGESVMRPLRARLATRSPRGPTDHLTSPKKARTRPRSRRSSPATTAATRRSRT